MSKSTTAAILSALVLPGAGHLYLKKFVRGIALITISLACAAVVVNHAIQQASLILDEIDLETAALDPGQVSALLTQAQGASGDGLAMLVLAGCWVVGIVDAYRLGKK